MKVYYGTNFWGRPKYARPLEEIKLNHEFVWEDISGFIPAVYFGSKGIAVDCCIRIPNKVVQEFFDKWEEKVANCPDREELEQMVEENPLAVDFNMKITVNGKELQNDFGCGTSYSKIITEKYHKENCQKPTEEEKIAKAYHCDDNSSWYIVRHQCRWKKKPDELKSLEIDFIAGSKAYPTGKMEMGVNCGEKVYEITHPLIGENYELKIHGIESRLLNNSAWKEMERKHCLEYPTQYIALSYEMIPDLPEQKFQLQDCSKGDSPREVAENQASGVSVISRSDSAIIGGADGPTAVFIAGTGKGTQKRTAMSALYFSPPEKIVWKPVFYEKERADMKLHIELPEKEA